MKKYILPLLLVVMLTLPAAPVSAQGQQYPAQLEYIDAQIELFLPRLDAFEYQYITQTGNYWQALTSHTSAPVGVEVPDNLAALPTDGVISLAVMWDYAALPDAIGWSWRVDTYNGPDGAGYVLNISTNVDGVVWNKSIPRGPEAWRGMDWYQEPVW